MKAISRILCSLSVSCLLYLTRWTVSDQQAVKYRREEFFPMHFAEPAHDPGPLSSADCPSLSILASRRCRASSRYTREVKRWSSSHNPLSLSDEGIYPTQLTKRSPLIVEMLRSHCNIRTIGHWWKPRCGRPSVGSSVCGNGGFVYQRRVPQRFGVEIIVILWHEGAVILSLH